MKRGLPVLCMLFAVLAALLWMRRNPALDEPDGSARETAIARALLEQSELPIPPAQARAREGTRAPQSAAAPPPASPALDDEGSPPVSEEEPPVEEIETGKCVLDLGVYDASNGHPVPDGVDLWRLALPGTPVWVAGDQLQAQAQLADGRARFEGLPEGRYRVSVNARRAGAEDPPEFLVRCPSTRVDLRVETPRRFRVLLDVRDESGLPLNQGVMHVPTDSMSIVPPDWSQRRVPRSGKHTDILEAVEWNSHGESRPIFAGGQGFEIGEYLEATPRAGASRHVLLEFEGRSSVRCPISYSGSELARMLAVSIPTQQIVERVRTRDGVALQAGQISIAAVCTAVSAAALADPQDWRQLPIRIEVIAPGYAALAVEHRLREGSLPELVLDRP